MVVEIDGNNADCDGDADVLAYSFKDDVRADAMGVLYDMRLPDDDSFEGFDFFLGELHGRLE